MVLHVLIIPIDTAITIDIVFHSLFEHITQYDLLNYPLSFLVIDTLFAMELPPQILS